MANTPEYTFDEHPNKRILQTAKLKYEIILNRHEGLWRIRPEVGALPNALSGGYTSPQQATLAIKNYIAAKKV